MAKKAKQNKQSETPQATMQVHPIIETGVTLVKFLVIFTAIAVFLLSIMAHARWYAVAFRTSLAMLVVGFFGWLINWIISKWVIAYEIQRLEEESKSSQNSDKW